MTIDTSALAVFALALSATHYEAGMDRIDRIALVCIMRQCEACIYLEGSSAPSLRIDASGSITAVDPRYATRPVARVLGMGDCQNVDRYAATIAA